MQPLHLLKFFYWIEQGDIDLDTTSYNNISLTVESKKQ